MDSHVAKYSDTEATDCILLERVFTLTLFVAPTTFVGCKTDTTIKEKRCSIMFALEGMIDTVKTIKTLASYCRAVQTPGEKNRHVKRRQNDAPNQVTARP